MRFNNQGRACPVAGERVNREIALSMAHLAGVFLVVIAGVAVSDMPEPRTQTLRVG
jgi:hypothetical protein